MTSVCRIGLALLVALASAPALAAPLAAYGGLPSIETAAISASGDQVAVVVTNGEERRIVVKDLVKDTIPLLASVGQTKVRDLIWAGDRHLILTTSSTQKPLTVIGDRGEYFFVSDIDVPKKKLRPLLGDAEQSMNILAGEPIVRFVRGKPLVLLQGITFVNSHGVITLFQADLDRARTRVVATGLDHTDGFLVGADGSPLAQTIYDRREGRWALRVRQDTVWHDLLVRDEPIDPPGVLGLGRLPRTVVLAGNEKDNFQWRQVSLDTGQTESLPSTDSQGAIHDPVTGRLLGLHALVGDEDRYTFFDAQDDRVWNAVTAAFPGDRVRLVAWSNDRRRILVRVDSATLGSAYSVVDLAARKATWLGAEYESLKSQDIGPVRPVRFQAADGLEITGYLTLPNGREAKNLPLVVLPHGGPAVRDTPGFDWWAQAIASRGYAVLQVNYRGSAGFGWDFEKAGFGEWGRKMQTDLSDGVAYLATEGVIDPKRVCIVGGSYGGYAAAAGVTLQHGIYRCAVSVAGVTDLRGQVAYSRRHEGQFALRYWTRFMGAEDLGDPVLAKYSPALHAADADAPILLIHGKDDTVVPLEQSTEMADALRKAGKPVELIVQDNADHWLSLGKTRLEMLEATVAFLEQHNPPQ